MLIAKFAMVVLLIWIVALVLYLQQGPSLSGGPFFYVDASASGQNPIQPKFKVPFIKVKDYERVLEVYNDRRGMPYLVKTLRYGKEISRRYYVRDASGKLRYEGSEPAWKQLRPARAR